MNLDETKKNDKNGSESAKSTMMSVHAVPFVPKNISSVSPQRELSVDAPEFVGRMNGISLIDGEYVSPSKSLSVNAQEFVPKSFCTPPSNGYDMFSNPLLELHHTIEVLKTCSPNDFDHIVQPFIASLSDVTHDSAFIEALLDEIFNQTLYQPNFRYFAARICKSLMENMLPSSETFEQLLLSRCCSFFNDLTMNLTTEMDDDAYLSTFAELLAELIINLKESVLIVQELPDLVKQLLGILLDRCNDQTLGVVTRILKMTGSVFSEHNIDIEDILTQAKTCTENINSPQALLLKSVVRQLSKHSVKPPHNNSNSLLMLSRARNYGIDLEPIYFDHAGQEFSAEEKEMIDRSNEQTTTEDSSYSNDQENNSSDVGDDEMDPEIEAAFDQFLRELDDSIVSPTLAPNGVPLSFTNGHSQISPSHSESQEPPKSVDSRQVNFTYLENQVMNRPGFLDVPNAVMRSQPSSQYIPNPPPQSIVYPNLPIQNSQYFNSMPALFNVGQPLNIPPPLLPSPSYPSVGSMANWSMPHGSSIPSNMISLGFYNGGGAQHLSPQSVAAARLDDNDSFALLSNSYLNGMPPARDFC